MVTFDTRLDQIKRQLIDCGKYFTMKRGRQYGKTTTLMALADYLKEGYIVLLQNEGCIAGYVPEFGINLTQSGACKWWE